MDELERVAVIDRIMKEIIDNLTLAGLSSPAVKVFYIVRAHLDNNFTAYPLNIDAIKKHCSFSVEEIIEALQELDEKGLITSEKLTVYKIPDALVEAHTK